MDCVHGLKHHGTGKSVLQYGKYFTVLTAFRLEGRILGSSGTDNEKNKAAM